MYNITYKLCICVFISITFAPVFYSRAELNGNVYCRNCKDSDNTAVNSKKRRHVANGYFTLGICILPAPPRDGNYTLRDGQDATPGEAVASFVMTVSCRRGFGIEETANASAQVICSEGVWSTRSRQMLECVRFCKLDVDPSVSYECYIPRLGVKPCASYVPPGTTVTITCQDNYFADHVIRDMTCSESGEWDRVVTCIADCGRVTPTAQLNLIGGAFAKFGEVPWHVGIYIKTEDPYQQICGGSIITNNVVISAAHCFWDDVRKLQPYYNYAVATGKLYRDWNAPDIGAQKSEVKEIKIPSHFQGSATSFQQDIAVLILTTPFVYKPYILPVCHNFNQAAHLRQLKTGNYGKVAGWGLAATNGEASKELKVLSLPFIDIDTCFKEVPPSFQKFLTADKFCAGYTNGTVCHGDSGGGLAFADIEQGAERYYLQGIVSASPRDDGKICNDAAYTALTGVSAHWRFIQESIEAATPKKCLWYQFQCDDGSCVLLGYECNGIQDCSDGSDESYAQCTAGATTTAPGPPRCKLPRFPAHGSYTVGNAPAARPGDIADSFLVIVTCDKGYTVQSGGFIEQSNSLELYCAHGEWFTRMPKCIPLCKLELSPSINYTCLVPGTNKRQPCEEYVIPGTSVKPTCTPEHYSRRPLSIMSCTSKGWNHVAKCLPECGRMLPVSEQIVMDKDLESAVRHGGTPWHAAIFRVDVFDLHRVGVIISKDVIITSAVFMTSNTWTYQVMVGKYFLKWNDIRDLYNQTSEVRDIKFPNSNNNMTIALLILETPIVFDKFIMPVCLDFDGDFKSDHNQGKMAVYAVTGEWINSSLTIVDVSFSDRSHICDSLYGTFQKIKEVALLEDKICGTFTDKEDNKNALPGSGLVSPMTESGAQRYYLRGVMPYSSRLCRYDDEFNFEYICKYHGVEKDIILTKINKHKLFISKYIS